MDPIQDLFDVFDEENDQQEEVQEQIIKKQKLDQQNNSKNIPQENQQEQNQDQNNQDQNKQEKVVYEKKQQSVLTNQTHLLNGVENKIEEEIKEQEQNLQDELEDLKKTVLPEKDGEKLDYKGQQVQKKQKNDRDHILEDFEIGSQKEQFDNCVHEQFYPIDQERNKKKISEGKGAPKQYPFKLDLFQRKAVECIELNESVLVAAHTSAGKTAIAEYAIALTKRENQKVIYTSPIKALSNQKFRELSEEFGDVGLITGDVTQNQNAQCLVMTTEILRSMLYRGSEIIREVKWVIFDEVHYMKDKERGVVWEETMILLNQNVRYVFLSATIPNAGEFAEWICKIKKQPCHVVYTDYRPTPLQHYIYPSGGKGIYLIVDDKGRFRENKFQEAVSCLGDNVEIGSTDKKKRKKPQEGAELYKIAKMIMEKRFDPVIIFSFSKKEVEGYATAMNKLDLTNVDEKEQIENVFKRAIAQLSEEDQQLPQIVNMLPQIKRGIGIHHGGLLPIIKEVIEILFQQGWIKILFSTETFSMGVNMPAKTVVFTSVRKFDGENFRWLNGSEYIQMSGRAGRRGLDSTGITILMVDEKLDQTVAKSMLKGDPSPLISSFHLNYNMLMNSMRMEDFDPEYIIRRSLHQFQKDKQLPEMKQKYQELEKQQDSMVIESEKQVADICKLDSQITKIKDHMKRIIITPQNACPFLSIGRLVRVNHKGVDWGWGISINFTQKKANKKKKQQTIQDDILVVVDVMLYIKDRKNNEEPQPQDINEAGGQMEIIPLDLECIQEISAIKLTLPKDLTAQTNKIQIKKTLQQIKQKFGENYAIIDPIKEMKISNEELDILVEKKQKLQNGKTELEEQFADKEKLKGLIQEYQQKQKIVQSLKLLETTIEQSEKMILTDDLKCMKRVMRRLQFIDKDDIVQMKGKVACEISAADEILGTELLFLGIFNDMEPAQISALLSCLLFDEKQNSEKMTVKEPTLLKQYNIVLDQAKKIFQILQESKIEIEEATYLGQINPSLIETVYAWCKGASFLEICKMSDAFEGSIIRCMRRLDELLKQMSNASKVIGNEDLGIKFDEASKLLKRGIIFAASLYL